MTAWTAPRTWTTGELVTAALMNTHVRDNELSLYEGTANFQWTSFTPTISSAGSPTVTTNFAKYIILGKWAVIGIRLTVNGAASGAGQIAVLIPSAIASANTGSTVVVGAGMVYRTATGIFYTGTVHAQFAQTLNVMGYGNNDFVGNAPSFTLAVGDIIAMQLSYQIS